MLRSRSNDNKYHQHRFLLVLLNRNYYCHSACSCTTSSCSIYGHHPCDRYNNKYQHIQTNNKHNNHNKYNERHYYHHNHQKSKQRQSIVKKQMWTTAPTPTPLLPQPMPHPTLHPSGIATSPTSTTTTTERNSTNKFQFHHPHVTAMTAIFLTNKTNYICCVQQYSTIPDIINTTTRFFSSINDSSNSDNSNSNKVSSHNNNSGIDPEVYDYLLDLFSNLNKNNTHNKIQTKDSNSTDVDKGVDIDNDDNGNGNDYTIEEIESFIQRILHVMKPVYGSTIKISHLNSFGKDGMKELALSVVQELHKQQQTNKKTKTKTSCMVQFVVPHHNTQFSVSWKLGQTLYDVVQNNPELLGEYIEGSCGGTMSCCTCHIYLDPIIAQQPDTIVEPPEESELDMLDLAYEPRTITITDTDKVAFRDENNSNNSNNNNNNKSDANADTNHKMKRYWLSRLACQIKLTPALLQFSTTNPIIITIPAGVNDVWHVNTWF